MSTHDTTSHVEIQSEWERFTGGPIESTRHRLHITINKKRRILFNANMYRRLGQPKALDLFFNCRRNQIALAPADLESPDSFPVRRNRGSFEIWASTFCRHYGLSFDSTQRFARPKFDETDRLILNLNETILVTRLDQSNNTQAIGVGK